MVTELWAHDPEPSPGGQKTSLSVLEDLSFHVGQAPRLPQEMLAFREELDVLKFLCKDLWMAVFQKQMDSLCTHHQGAYAYVLHDNSFPFLTQMASDPQCLEDAPEEWGALGLRPDLISPTYLALTPGRPLPEPSEALSQVSASPSSHNE